MYDTWENGGASLHESAFEDLFAAMVAAITDDAAPYPCPVTWPPAARRITEYTIAIPDRVAHRHQPNRQQRARMVYTHPK